MKYEIVGNIYGNKVSSLTVATSAWYSALADDCEMTVYFLAFHKIDESLRNM